MRPRFFAGQLLTEDDLSALIDYVISKNRFHNARLFGEGVVCGLLVECGACDGQIVVDPGYALDCCGNDLVLTCAQTLDIAKLIRELAANKHADCVKPCTDTAAAQPKDGTKTPDKYDLYIRYAERPDQPVAAYPVGGDCDAASCEPTRIVEGVVFELRCPTNVQHPNIHAAEECCKKRGLDSKYLLETAATLRYLVGWIDEDTATEPSAAFRDQARDALQFKSLLDGLHGNDRIVALTRFTATGAAALSRAKDLGLTSDEQSALRDHVATAVKQLSGASLDDLHPVDAALAKAVVDITGRPELRSRSSTTSHELLFTPELMRALREILNNIANQLNSAPACGPTIHTDCGLKAALQGLSPSFDATVEKPQILRLREVSWRAVDAIKRVIADCLCAAINPPCPPCDDSGVLIARIEVDNCKVVKICNSVREYVYAPSSLRYWDAIEVPHLAICCDSFRRFPKRELEVGLDLRNHVEKIEAMSAAHASLRMLMTPATPAIKSAATHEGELAALRSQVQALEARIAKFEVAAEKPAKGKS